MIYRSIFLTIRRLMPMTELRDRIQWHRDRLHAVMSCTKSASSAIIGIAVDQGYMDVQVSIFTYLPDHRQYNTNGKDKITVEHLLTMTSGLEWDEWSAMHGTSANDIDRIYFKCQDDPLACILAKELVNTPGTHFTYRIGNMIVYWGTSAECHRHEYAGFWQAAFS